MRTVFITPTEWQGESVELAGEVHHHLFRVGRVAVGEVLRVADGTGRARLGTVDSVDKKTARLVLGGRAAANESSVAVELLVVAPKKPRAEWLVEKATEVGVTAVRFLHSERGPRSFGDGAFGRFRRIAESAAAQSARSVVPDISGMHELSDVPGLVEAVSRSLVLHPEGSPLAAQSDETSSGSIALLVGPEGGWAGNELAEFAALGLPLARLGPRVLRVETAALIAAAACVAVD